MTDGTEEFGERESVAGRSREPDNRRPALWPSPALLAPMGPEAGQASPGGAVRRGARAALAVPVEQFGSSEADAGAWDASIPHAERWEPATGDQSKASDRSARRLPTADPRGALDGAKTPDDAPSNLLPSPALPVGRRSGRLAALAETAKAYARAAQADNTVRAYTSDWKQFASWLRRQGLPELPPDPEAVGLYLTAQVERGGAELAVSTLERRLSGIAWRYRQLGQPLDLRDRHIATVLAGIRRRHARPPRQKAAVFADELIAMLATLDMDLRGLRDRAILAIGFAGGLRRSEIVGLDCGPDETEDGAGWINVSPGGALLTIRGKTGWREVEIGRGSRSDTCPVALLETWMRLGRIARGPVFRAIARKAGGVGSERLTDKHVVRLVKRCALAAGLRGELTEGERRLAFAGHSVRAGLASSAQIEEAHVQKHLGHASAEMTRRYQRKRDRFSVNLTKAAGL
jgi:integrase